MNLSAKMDEISAQLIKGEITQPEALKRQRELLMADIPEQTEQFTTEVSAPVVSAEIRADNAIAGYQAKKADVAAQLATVKERTAELQAEKDRLMGAIAASEQRLNILAGSPQQYRSAKAEAIAQSLVTGEALDPTSLPEPEGELVDRVSAVDLKAALQVLRTKAQEIERRLVGCKADQRRLINEFAEHHAGEHGVRFALLASRLSDEYAAVQAAHRIALSSGNTFSVLAPQDFSEMLINSPLSAEAGKACGITRRVWSGRVLEETTIIRNATAEIYSELEGAL